MLYNRRLWMQQSLTALAATALSTNIIARTTPAFSPLKGTILLNSNENPYGPSPMARKAMLQHYLTSNRYPDDYILLLKKKIANHCNVSPENILLGAGSSEIIGLSCLLVSQKKKKVITTEPGYKVWNGQAASFGLEFERIPLTNERIVDLQAIQSAVNDETAMVYICNPNNPTGTFTPVNKLSNFATEVSKKTIVFIDEAYTEYANLESLAAQAITNPNIVVAKTFSKVYGLAGARIGYAIAHPDTIAKLANLQPWSDGGVSLVSAAAAMASLDDTNYVKDILEKTVQARTMCTVTFKQLSLDYIPSHTNFILFNIDGIKKDCIKEMEVRNIYVQSRNHFNGKWCRVSMGTLVEMKTFCEALKEIV
ncbi:pyridoxal phosphate-dependent aminotransferase [Ferruginibacter sp.]|uniref:pyridoxal phosphate-dependent aminotransferase n=1 Tax=Ferruginibacter sp. TaxID=1940288 RepID=UPI00374DB015